MKNGLSGAGRMRSRTPQGQELGRRGEMGLLLEAVREHRQRGLLQGLEGQMDMGQWRLELQAISRW